MSDQDKPTWLSRLRPGRLLLETWILSAIIVSVSNVFAQLYDAHSKKQSFTFDLPRLLRFLILDLITAPLNYKWQELLDTTFPRFKPTSSGKYQSIPLEERDVEKDSNAGDLEEDEENEDEDNAAGSSTPRQQKRKTKKHRRKKSLKKNWKNIFTKWFVDCITLGAIGNTLLFLVFMGLLNGKPERILSNIRTQTMVIIINGYKLWPFANIIAQTFIPFERRIIFFAMVALFWNIYLSIIAAVL